MFLNFFGHRLLHMTPDPFCAGTSKTGSYYNKKERSWPGVISSRTIFSCSLF
jgi:hypothetical protein